jgi:hypothetical protein
MTMESILVVRQTFWELEQEIPAERRSRSYSDFDVRYGGDHVLAALSEDGAKLDDACCKATVETSSSVGCSTDLSENWADIDTDTESNESENYCATPPPEQEPVQHVMMPMRFVMVPVAQTNIAPPPGNFAPPTRSVAPPPGNFSLSPVKVQKKPERTTVVLRNLPSQLSRSDLVKILDDAGFSERYDFLYLPTNFRNMTVFGYAIVNFSEPADAQAAMEQFRGANVDGQDVITEWSKSQQGYADLVCRYRDSPVMHTSVPDQHKPIILAKGVLQPFPQPTELLQPPRKFAPTQDQGSILP